MKHSKKIIILCVILLLSGFVLCGLGVRQFVMETSKRAAVMENFDAESLHPKDDISEDIHIIDETDTADENSEKKKENESKTESKDVTDEPESEKTTETPVVTEVPENTAEGEANGQ